MHPSISLLSAVVLVALTASTAPAQAAAPRVSADTSAEVIAGREMYQMICAACHVMDPPYAVAPPMSHVARHYRQAYPVRERFIERVVSFVRAPSADSSALEPHAIERFGLMPALPLIPEARLRAVAAYLWTLEPAPHTMTMPPARP